MTVLVPVKRVGDCSVKIHLKPLKPDDRRNKPRLPVIKAKAGVT